MSLCPESTPTNLTVILTSHGLGLEEVTEVVIAESLLVQALETLNGALNVHLDAELINDGLHQSVSGDKTGFVHVATQSYKGIV